MSNLKLGRCHEDRSLCLYPVRDGWANKALVSVPQKEWNFGLEPMEHIRRMFEVFVLFVLHRCSSYVVREHWEDSSMLAPFL